MSAVTLPQAAAPSPPARAGGPGPTAAPARSGAGRQPGGMPDPRRVFGSSAETALAIGVVAVVGLLVLPLPPFMLDAFLALSFGLSLVVLLVTLSTRNPLEFSIFPTVLVLVTLLRLGLNVSSTRLILTTGHAGQVIGAFGDFVIGGNVVVGLVLFLILVVINFMVITKGAGRIAEVAARFTLDAMPGRQMSIDADLSAGMIDEHEARRRRDEITRYADFFGAMDGAAKFVRGDAVAGIAITGINLVGGFLIGVTQQGLSARDALHTFSALTVGDGLVTQIPALIVSTASGLLVTYGTSGSAMAPSIASQMTRHPRTWWTAGAILALFGLVPGLPSLPFLLLATGCGALGWFADRMVREGDDGAPRAAAEPATEAPAESPAREMLAVDPLELEVGYALVPLVDGAQGGDLLSRIAIVRKQLALELGILVPPVRIRDNIQLAAGEYVVRMRGVRVSGGEILPRQLLALDTHGGLPPLDGGTPTRDPSFDLPAAWIENDGRVAAEAAGYTVVEPVTVLTTHLMEIVREHAGDLLSRQNVRELLDALKETHPALVDDIVPNRLSLGVLHRVLQRLLREGLPVRDLVTILEALSDGSEQTKDPEALAEHARRALAHAIAQMLGGAEQPVRALTVGPRLELALMQLFSPRSREGGRTLEPEELTRVLQSLHRLAQLHKHDGQWPPLVTPPALRVGIRRLVEPVLPRLPVISLGELPPQTPLQSIATWELTHAA